MSHPVSSIQTTVATVAGDEGLDGRVYYAVAKDVDLGVGSTLLLYTDGVSESTDALGEELGLGALDDLLAAKGERPAATIGAELEGSIAERSAGRPVADDRSWLVLRRRAGAVR